MLTLSPSQSIPVPHCPPPSSQSSQTAGTPLEEVMAHAGLTAEDFKKDLQQGAGADDDDAGLEDEL